MTRSLKQDHLGLCCSPEFTAHVLGDHVVAAAVENDDRTVHRQMLARESKRSSSSRSTGSQGKRAQATSAIDV
ncbi:hypothetical protein MetexDRAFT_0613 [Methylorubrum extorquens DSM 13060]|uniref:Uncharacterized protein n=1 Tax=Methylorubrum extorquens DSM 13060 TaxID=882800 RepID=H1KDA1_METEX|nr:hypothetical protein MetexDRAFT_0613 [Methylorubrum extorquens DSM 13060]